MWTEDGHQMQAFDMKKLILQCHALRLAQGLRFFDFLPLMKT